MLFSQVSQSFSLNLVPADNKTGTHTRTSRPLHSRCSTYLTRDYLIASFSVGRPLICAHHTHLSTGPWSDTHTHTLSSLILVVNEFQQHSLSALATLSLQISTAKPSLVFITCRVCLQKSFADTQRVTCYNHCACLHATGGERDRMQVWRQWKQPHILFSSPCCSVGDFFPHLSVKLHLLLQQQVLEPPTSSIPQITAGECESSGTHTQTPER